MQYDQGKKYKLKIMNFVALNVFFEHEIRAKKLLGWDSNWKSKIKKLKYVSSCSAWNWERCKKNWENWKKIGKTGENGNMIKNGEIATNHIENKVIALGKKVWSLKKSENSNK